MVGKGGVCRGYGAVEVGQGPGQVAGVGQGGGYEVVEEDVGGVGGLDGGALFEDGECSLVLAVLQEEAAGFQARARVNCGVGADF